MEEAESPPPPGSPPSPCCPGRLPQPSACAAPSPHLHSLPALSGNTHREDSSCLCSVSTRRGLRMKLSPPPWPLSCLLVVSGDGTEPSGASCRGGCWGRLRSPSFEEQRQSGRAFPGAPGLPVLGTCWNSVWSLRRSLTPPCDIPLPFRAAGSTLHPSQAGALLADWRRGIQGR